MERTKVIEYLANLDCSEKRRLLEEVLTHENEISEKKYQNNKKSYENLRKKHEAIGELMKNSVVPGDIVKCRGTNDRMGFREVLECNEDGIKARKLVKDRVKIKGQIKWVLVRGDYITNHYWNKVAKIYNKSEIIPLYEEN